MPEMTPMPLPYYSQWWRIDRFYINGFRFNWQYVENIWLEQGVDSSKSNWWGFAASTLVGADAVRIGGGTGDVQRYGVQTNRPLGKSLRSCTRFNGT